MAALQLRTGLRRLVLLATMVSLGLKAIPARAATPSDATPSLAEPSATQSVANDPNTTQPATVPSAAVPPVATAPAAATQSVPNTQAGTPGGGPSTPANLAPEVVGFFLQGKLPYQKIKIGDLDVLVNGKERLVPLRRLLTAMGLKSARKDNTLTFPSVTGAELVIDLATKTLTGDGAERTIEVFEAEALVAQEADVFVPVAVADQLLGMQTEWQEQQYQFVSRTERALALWALPATGLTAPLKTVPVDLPEMFGENTPPRNSLDFIELQTRLRGQAYTRQTPSLSLDATQESFWGSLEGGQYKLTLAQPAVTYAKTWSVIDQPAVTMPWGDVTFRTDNSELVFGDSSAGLSDLVFPFVQLTGVRFNGLFNAEDYVKKWDQSGLGLQRYFGQIQEFQGFADVGTKAELYVNDRLIAQDEVLTATTGAPPGQGLWRFRDVQIPTGTRNDVRIVTTSPAGIRTQLERTIMGTSFLVPEGATAVLAEAGVNRDPTRWNARGFLTGVRVLQGMTPTLTIGGTVAFEDAFNRPMAPNTSDPFYRQYPRSSTHMALEFTAAPLDTVLINGELAAVLGEERDDPGSFLDSAFRLQADFSPVSELTFHGSLFRFGTDYFNGDAIRPRDREGFVLGGRWKITQGWTFQSSLGYVLNNLDGDLAETVRARFMSARLTTSALPSSTLSLEYDRLESAGSGGRNLYTLSLNSRLPWSLELNASAAIGDTLSLKEDSEFFSGINVPDLPLFESPTVSIILGRPFEDAQNLALSYQQSVDRERLTLIHNIRLLQKPNVTMRTEAGVDFNAVRPYFDNRIECVMNPTGQTRLGLEIRLEDGIWSAVVFLNVTELLANDHGHFREITDLGFTPDYGAVHGRVFRDVNANGKLDPEEVGVGQVKVYTRTGQTATTDDDGYYMIQTGMQPRQDQVFLDMNTVPADLSPINGTQRVRVARRTLSDANLAVGPLYAVTGQVFTRDASNKRQPLAGVLVYVTAVDDTTVIRESFTAGDGSYYLGNMRPGTFLLRVQANTLPPNCVMPELQRTIVVQAMDEPQDVKPEPFEGRTNDGSATQAATQATTQAATQATTEPATAPTTQPDLQPKVILPE